MTVAETIRHVIDFLSNLISILSTTATRSYTSFSGYLDLYFGKSLWYYTPYKDSLTKIYIGQGLPELTPVELVGYEDTEAGSPLALDNG